jgi:glycosyltransferase involved in cell wall biosynthesis
MPQTVISNTPKISIIITAYNHEKYIFDSISSVLNQSYQDFEIIVINDGSKDKTASIIKGMVSQYPEKIIFIDNKNNIRPKFTCNQGISAARGKYIAWNDGDDLWLPEKLEKQMKVFDLDYKNEIHIVYSLGENIIENSTRIRNKIDGKLVEKNFFKEMFASSFFLKNSMMVRKEVYDKLGLLNEKYQLCGDYEYMIRMAASGYKFKMVNESLALHRIHENNETTNRSIAINNTKIMLKDVSQTYHNLIKKYNINVKDRLSVCDYQIARYFFAKKSYSKAKHICLEILKSNIGFLIRNKTFCYFVILCFFPKRIHHSLKNISLFQNVYKAS